MRSSWLLPVVLAGQGYSATPHASIYVFNRDPVPARSNIPTVSPAAARLLFAKWLGISQYHRLGDLDESSVSRLNSVRGGQRLLADAEDWEKTPTRLLILLEGVENVRDVFTSEEAEPSFQMDSVPSPLWNKKLARTLSEQLADKAGRSRSCGSPWETDDGYEVQVFTSGAATRVCCPAITKLFSKAGRPSDQGSAAILRSLRQLEELLHRSLRYWCGSGLEAVFYVSGIDMIIGLDGSSSAAYKEATAAMSQTLGVLLELAKMGEMESMIGVFHPVKGSVKRSIDPYGEYISGARPALHPRQSSEEPLAASVSEVSSSSMAQPMATPTVAPGNTTSPKGIIPLCHSSLNTCVTATGNCSGHGACYKKYGPPSGGDSAGRDCYACRCVPTTVRDGDGGGKTIYWGGSACQKKDVSVPFFLLAGISILIVGAISSAIGLLFSVGQDTLPGVLSAAVAGPRPK